MTGTESAQRVLKGRARRLALGVAFLIAATAGSIGLVRMTSLRGLPAIEEPFDARTYATIPIPDDENAFTFFRRATDRIVGQESDISGSASLYSEWSQIPPETLRSLEQNRESLDLWLEGTRRDRAIYVQPGTATIETQLPVIQRLRSFARMATFRAMRSRIDGDDAGAWMWIKAGLRAGLLTGQNGFPIERLVGIQHYNISSIEALRWADDPKVDAQLLRRALDDVVGAELLAPDYPQTIRFEYYSLMNTLADPAATARVMEDSRLNGVKGAPGGVMRWLFPAYAALRREPERSRRVGRLVIDNWLWAVDRPAADRASRVVMFGPLHLYRRPPDDPGPIGIDELASWFESTAYGKIFLMGWKFEAARARDEQARAGLIVHLAERLFEKERGRPPASPDELVGPYLKALPAGYIRPPADANAQGSPR